MTCLEILSETIAATKGQSSSTNFSGMTIQSLLKMDTASRFNGGRPFFFDEKQNMFCCRD